MFQGYTERIEEIKKLNNFNMPTLFVNFIIKAGIYVNNILVGIHEIQERKLSQLMANQRIVGYFHIPHTCTCYHISLCWQNIIELYSSLDSPYHKPTHYNILYLNYRRNVYILRFAESTDIFLSGCVLDIC